MDLTSIWHRWCYSPIESSMIQIGFQQFWSPIKGWCRILIKIDQLSIKSDRFHTFLMDFNLSLITICLFLLKILLKCQNWAKINQKSSKIQEKVIFFDHLGLNWTYFELFWSNLSHFWWILNSSIESGSITIDFVAKM